MIMCIELCGGVLENDIFVDMESGDIVCIDVFGQDMFFLKFVDDQCFNIYLLQKCFKFGCEYRENFMCVYLIVVFMFVVVVC